MRRLTSTPAFTENDEDIDVCGENDNEDHRGYGCQYRTVAEIDELILLVRYGDDGGANLAIVELFGCVCARYLSYLLGR